PAVPGLPSTPFGVNDFLRRLFTWYKALPDYTKRTRTVARHSSEFRRVLASATDPVALLFTQLPAALDVPDSSHRRYTRRFGAVIRDLSSTHGRLLHEICGRIAALFATSQDVSSIVGELKLLSEAV